MRAWERSASTSLRACRRCLRDAAVELRTSYRFRDQPGIGALARAIRRQDAGRALGVVEARSATQEQILALAARPGAGDAPA